MLSEHLLLMRNNILDIHFLLRILSRKRFKHCSVNPLGVLIHDIFFVNIILVPIPTPKKQSYFPKLAHSCRTPKLKFFLLGIGSKRRIPSSSSNEYTVSIEISRSVKSRILQSKSDLNFLSSFELGVQIVKVLRSQAYLVTAIHSIISNGSC
jgi:hypothetical protein